MLVYMGMAIAARMPITATTTISSMRVKPRRSVARLTPERQKAAMALTG
jgi:hypothetical protein